MTALEKQLDRLHIGHPVVQRGAIEALFASIAERDTVNTQAGRKALQACLRHKDELTSIAIQAVVEAAVGKLCAFVPAPGLTRNEALDLLLAALTTADVATVGALVGGVLILFRAEMDGEAPSGMWQQHPLSKALTAHPAAQIHLLAAVPRLLLEAGRLRDEHLRNSFLSALKPFFSFALLDPDAKGMRAAFALAVHEELVRLCSGGAPLRQFALQLLLTHLRCHNLASPQRRTWVLSILQDVFEAVQAKKQPAGEQELITLAATMVHLSAELKQTGAPLQRPLRVLRQIVLTQPGVLAAHIIDLGALVTRAGADDSRDLFSLMALIASQTQDSRSTQLALQGMLLFPVVQTLAFDSSSTLKAWANHLLSILGTSKSAGSSSTRISDQHADSQPCSLEQEAFLLAHEWHMPGGALSAIQCLQSLDSLLTRQPKASADNNLPELLSPSMSMILAAALSHPNTDVQLAAVSCVVSTARAFPLMGISLLPLLIYQLQASTAGNQVDSSSSAATLQLALLNALPELATHSACIPLVIRALSPLSAPGAPEVLQALALRLQLKLWRASGRNFQRLQTALLGYAAPGTKPGLALRTSRAACVRDICAVDPDRGTELVTAIQDALHDDSDAVAALGMEAMSLLCEADALDFYAAWRVVQQQFPTLPSRRPLLAQRWVGLLAHGNLDAKMYPDRAAAILDLLWLAAVDRDAQVRREAYKALGNYNLVDMESLGALRLLSDFAQLVLNEVDVSAVQECEKLVAKALAYEHSIRRRFIASDGRGGRRRVAPELDGDTKALVQQLTRKLPRKLLSPEGLSANAAPGALLFLWAPPRPQSSADPNAEAEHAAHTYAKQFLPLVERAPSSLLGHHSLAILGWRAFMGRWVAAEFAAQDQDNGSSQKAVRKIYRDVQQPTGTCDLAKENVSLAVAALCSLPGREDSDLAAEVVLDGLTRLEEDRSAGSSKAAALAVGVAVSSLHPTDKGAREAAGWQLLCHLATHPSGAVRAACAEAAGILAASLKPSQTIESPYNLSALSILASLLYVLRALSPNAGLEEAAAALPLPGWQPQPLRSEPSEDDEAVGGIFAGIANAMTGIVTEGISSALLQGLADLLSRPIASQSASIMKGVCIALPAVASAAIQAGQRDVGVAQLLDDLRVLLESHPHGSVRGAAAAALGSLLAAPNTKQGLLFPVLPQALKDLWVPALCTALAAAQKLPGSGPLSYGVLAGLSAVLGAAGIVPGITGDASGALLADKEASGALQLVLKAMEALAGRKGPPNSRATAAWLLAASCHNARRALQQGLLAGDVDLAQVSEGAYLEAMPATFRRGLKSLQPEGALKPLVKSLILIHRGAEAGSGSKSSVASLLRCVAAAERLPEMPWAEICQNFISADDSTAVAAQSLAIRHGTIPSSGLSELLDGLLEPRRFATLALPLQELLLQRLPEAFAALSASRRISCLQAIARMTRGGSSAADKSSPGNSTIPKVVNLQQAAWEGLAQLTEMSSGADSLAASSAIWAAVRDLYEELPPPPPMPASWSEAEGSGAQQATGTQQSTLPPIPDSSTHQDPEQGAVERVWAAAMACLGLFEPAQVISLLEVISLAQARAAKAVAARCRLVQLGRLNAAELQVCRNFCIAGSYVAAAPLMAELAAAATRSPAAVQVQMLLVTLETVQVCETPLQALQLAAVFAAVWAAQQQGMPFEALISARSPTAALAVFPSSLVSLLQQCQWQQATKSVGQRLVALQSSSVTTHADHALIALRIKLSTNNWQHISAAAMRQ